MNFVKGIKRFGIFISVIVALLVAPVGGFVGYKMYSASKRCLLSEKEHNKSGLSRKGNVKEELDQDDLSDIFRPDIEEEIEVLIEQTKSEIEKKYKNRGKRYF
jgi:hypothetical protein